MATESDDNYGFIFRPSTGSEKGYAMHGVINPIGGGNANFAQASGAAERKSLKPDVSKTTVIDYNHWCWAAQEHWVKGERIPTLMNRIRSALSRTTNTSIA